ncbi:DUF2752 domain-containing protein [Kitasatospora sp. NBC_00315]
MWSTAGAPRATPPRGDITASGPSWAARRCSVGERNGRRIPLFFPGCSGRTSHRSAGRSAPAAATGKAAPGCGGTRTAYDPLHGALVAARHDDAALLPAPAGLCGTRLRPGGRMPAAARARPPGYRGAALGAAALRTIGRDPL